METSNETKNNNLNDLIDPRFDRDNRLFMLWLKNEYVRTSYEKYYTPTIEIKDCNVLIDGKSFFVVHKKKKKKKRSIKKDYWDGKE